MENILNYYYNLKKIEVFNVNNNYLILDDNNFSYFLSEIDNNINISNIIHILSNLKPINNYGNLVLNNNKSYITKINDKNYVLIRLKGVVNENVELSEIINNNLEYRYLKSNNTNLTELWSKKIDYLEYQVSEIGNNHEEVLNSFSFFVGLAENAISFININNINYNNTHKTLSHYRLNHNPINLDYYNPLNILIDYDIRDYSEYIKSKLLQTDDVEKDIKYILDNANLSNDDIKLFYARLMFPTLYFDKVEDILLNNNQEKELEIYIETIPRYLDLLKDTYLEINKKGISIDIPNWIIKS